MKWTPFLLLVPLAVIGSWASVRAEKGPPAMMLMALVLTGVSGGVLWWWMCRRHDMPLVLASAIWNVVYEGVYLVAMTVMAREALTTRQIIGIVTAMAGGFLMGGK
jgi:uncharacterized membrane protein YeiH